MHIYPATANHYKSKSFHHTFLDLPLLLNQSIKAIRFNDIGKSYEARANFVATLKQLFNEDSDGVPKTPFNTF